MMYIKQEASVPGHVLIIFQQVAVAAGDPSYGTI